jgi:hypothetical protein
MKMRPMRLFQRQEHEPTQQRRAEEGKKEREDKQGEMHTQSH